MSRVPAQKRRPALYLLSMPKQAGTEFTWKQNLQHPQHVTQNITSMSPTCTTCCNGKLIINPYDFHVDVDERRQSARQHLQRPGNRHMTVPQVFSILLVRLATSLAIATYHDASPDVNKLRSRITLRTFYFKRRNKMS